jgi:hypothetical protein
MYTRGIAGTTRSGLYVWVRDVHLYSGLFIGPFLIVFSLSAILLNHPSAQTNATTTTASAPVRVPEGIDRLEGMARVAAARTILNELGFAGEINFVNVDARRRTLSVPVSRPGWEATVRVDLERGLATVETRRRGVADAMHWLHKLPGPHLAMIRGNWLYTRIWSVLSDSIVYLLLLISATGIYLWAVLRAERKAGLILLGAGAATFAGIIYALAN